MTTDKVETSQPDEKNVPGAEQDSSGATPDRIVRATGVRKVFRMGEEEVHALKGVDFKVNRGEYIALMGPSGSGKSTLFNMIGGLDKPNAGKVYIDEVDIAALSTFELAWLRCHKIGYIFQTYNLIPVATALDNVMLPMLFADVPQTEAQDKAVELLGKVGLGERVLHKPVQMSGGQQQRVAIARSLANDPAIILADEPTANLDSSTGRQIIELLKELNRSENVTVISATHDHKMLATCDRIAWLTDGVIERFAARDELDIEEGHAGLL